MSTFSESFSLLPPDENATSHLHDDGRRSHNDECVPTRSQPQNLTAWDFFFHTGPAFHSDIFPSHDDNCLYTTECFITGSSDTNPLALMGMPPRQELSSEHSRTWPMDNQQVYDFMDEDEASRGTEDCGSRCSQDGPACEEACREMCETPCIINALCDPSTFCTEENCSKPQVGHDVAHASTILHSISGAKHNQQPIDPNLQALHSNSNLTFPYTDQPFSFVYHNTVGQTNHFHGEGLQQFHGSSHPEAQNFPQRMDFSQTFGEQQTGSLVNPAGYASPPFSSQSLSLPSDLAEAVDMSRIQPAAGYERTFSTAFDDPFMPQQPSWDTPMPLINCYPGQGSTSWHTGLPQRPPSVGSFNFNTERDGDHVGQMYKHRQDLPDCGDYISMPSSPGMSTPSFPIRGMADTPSPMDLDHKDDTHRCLWRLHGDEICGRTFNDVQGLHDHIDDAHIKDLQPEGRDGFVCRWLGCRRQISASSTMKDKRGFDGRSKLKRHICTPLHAGSLQTFACDICHKMFGNAQALRTHKVKHSDDRPFACGVDNCGKTFKTQDSLKVHKQNAHSTTKRYHCDICLKSFKDSSNFSKHKKTHVDSKEWQCNECGEGFARRDQLFRHAGKVHKIGTETLELLYPMRVRGGAHARRVSVGLRTTPPASFDPAQAQGAQLTLPSQSHPNAHH